MAPPTWALLERELIKTQTEACKLFFERYFDERGYLQCAKRWGANDGPDDAIECLRDWPTLHALGAPDSILDMYKRAWEEVVGNRKALIPWDEIGGRAQTRTGDLLRVKQAL